MWQSMNLGGGPEWRLGNVELAGMLVAMRKKKVMAFFRSVGPAWQPHNEKVSDQAPGGLDCWASAHWPSLYLFLLNSFPFLLLYFEISN
jgi:hypothetical protein